MPDTLTFAQRHHVMSQVHSSSTKPELRLRYALWRLGFRYLVNDKRLPGSPDIVLPKYKTVIFVHGCFWHGHKGCKKYTVPKTNTEFWTAKVSRNQERDQEVWRKLEAKGWSVIIVWECELGKRKMEETVLRVASEVKANGDLHERRQMERKAERKLRRMELAASRVIQDAHMKEIHRLEKANNIPNVYFQRTTD